MPEGRTKDKLLILIIFLLLGGLIGIVARECSQPKKKLNPTLVETVKVLRDTIRLYEPAKYQPAIIRIRDRYRVLLDTVERLTFDTSWQNVCRLLPDSTNGESCQREVVRRLISGRRDSELIGIYQAQRTEDSLQIGMMFKLDSMTSELLKEKDADIAEAKKQVRRKVAKNAFIGGLLGFIMGVVL